MYRAHKICLNPNVAQANYFARACGVARFAYNWALSEWKRQYETGDKPNWLTLNRLLNKIKRDDFPWMVAVTKCAPANALVDLNTVMQRFIKGEIKYPKFRRKGVNDKFRLNNDQFVIDGSRIRIPKLGWVRMREALRFTGKLISCTISRRADKWFASIVVDTEPVLKPAENQGTVGIDLGLTTFATLSNGQKIAAPKPLVRLLPKLKRLSRAFSRKQKGSKNREKARIKLVRLHLRIWNIRQDFLHKLTSDLTRRYNTICVEDLNVSGMLRNKKLARAISDVGWYEFRRQLEYKSAMRGNNLVFADRFFASSKLCSACGHKTEEMPLSVRQWQCPCCGAENDRDVNAAVNLKQLAAGRAVTACGEGSSGVLETACETAFCEAGMLTKDGHIANSFLFKRRMESTPRLTTAQKPCC